MKAIYINLDPYLAEFAAWLKAGRPGTAPSFDPLPLAVTLGLGETAAIALPFDVSGAEGMYTSATIDGETVLFCYDTEKTSGIGDSLATGQTLGLSSAAPSAKYTIAALTSGAPSVSVEILVYDENLMYCIIVPFTVLVRRETAQGPVDLVDFTPPAAAPSAADIKSALVAAGNGALAGVNLGGAIIWANQDPSSETPTEGATLYTSTGSAMLGVVLAPPGDLGVCLGGTIAS